MKQFLLDMVITCYMTVYFITIYSNIRTANNWGFDLAIFILFAYIVIKDKANIFNINENKS